MLPANQNYSWLLEGMLNHFLAMFLGIVCVDLQTQFGRHSG
jgi:hypothetical protein